MWDNRARALIHLNRYIEGLSNWRKLLLLGPKIYNAIIVKQLVGALRLICRSQIKNAQCFNQSLEMLNVLERGVLQECDLHCGRGYAHLLIKLIYIALNSESGFLLHLNYLLVC